MYVRRGESLIAQQKRKFFFPTLFEQILYFIYYYYYFYYLREGERGSVLLVNLQRWGFLMYIR